ncbi:MAG: MarR family transcriptional regulator [Dehalococcoidia bacterium]|nr:MarR family transcriptional regulator [Dehalococcoidia bacterium]
MATTNPKPNPKAKSHTDADQDFELWALLHQVRDAVAKARENELRQADISMIKAAVLFFVKNMNGPATPAQISRYLFREPHTISGLLDRMESQGLVRRVRDLQRKNLVRIEVTEKGEEAYRKSREGRKAISKIMSTLSEEEHANLRSYLERLRNKALKEIGVKTRLPFP